jgi:hypothetical protein
MEPFIEEMAPNRHNPKAANQVPFLRQPTRSLSGALTLVRFPGQLLVAALGQLCAQQFGDVI